MVLVIVFVLSLALLRVLACLMFGTLAVACLLALALVAFAPDGAFSMAL